MRRTIVLLFAAVTPSLGWAAASFPRSTADVLTLLVAGWFIALASAVLPRRMGVVVIAWWLLVVACWAHVWLPWVTGFWWFSWVGPVHVPVLAAEVVKPASFFLACTWWALAFAPVVRGFLDVETDSGDDTEPAQEEVTPPSSRVRDLTLNHTPAHDAPIVADRVRNLGPDRYAGLVIHDESDDVEDTSGGGGIVAEALAVWPANRAREDGKVPLTDLAELVGMEARDLAAELAVAGVDCPRENVRPVVRPGNPSRQKAVSWSALRAVGCATARPTP